jgi:hypothetical protein
MKQSAQKYRTKFKFNKQIIRNRPKKAVKSLKLPK